MAGRKKGDETGTAVMVRFTPQVGAALVAKANAEGRRITDVVRQAVGELVLPAAGSGQSQQVKVP